LAALTNSFSGIAPIDVLTFIFAQLAGALAGLVAICRTTASANDCYLRV
jgi:hypothetical protein